MVTIGARYMFRYPVEFVTLLDYSAHRGHTVKVERQLDASEADCGPEVEPMFAVVCEDGWRGQAFESELEG